MNFQKALIAGNLPYLAVAIVGVSCYLLGASVNKPPAKFATAERGAIVLEAVLERGINSPELLEDEVAKPIRGVLQKYIDQGYVVIDSSKDEAGNMTIAALPLGVIDITAEMRAAVQNADKQVAPSAVSGASQ